MTPAASGSTLAAVQDVRGFGLDQALQPPRADTSAEHLGAHGLHEATDELLDINRVVAASVRSWTLSEGVLRRALPSLLYDHVDLDYMNVMVADDANGDAIGVAVWEPAGRQDAPRGARGLSLHGLYVEPRWQREGVGTGLLEMVVERAEARAFDGIGVRAWRHAEPFFLARGFAPLDLTRPSDRYPRRLWLHLA